MRQIHLEIIAELRKLPPGQLGPTATQLARTILDDLDDPGDEHSTMWAAIEELEQAGLVVSDCFDGPWQWMLTDAGRAQAGTLISRGPDEEEESHASPQ